MQYSPSPSCARLKRFFRPALALVLGAMIPLGAGAQRIGSATPTQTFLDDAQRIELVSQGPGWNEIRLYDANGVAQSSSTLIGVSPHGLPYAPLTENQKQELNDDFALMGIQTGYSGGGKALSNQLGSKTRSTHTIFIHKELADAMENGESLTPWMSYAESADPNSFGCSGWKTKTKTGNWSFSEQSHGDEFDLGNTNITGRYQIDLPIQGQATMEFTYSYKRNFLCIPYKFRFDQVHTFGNMTVTGDSLLDASVALQGHWEKEWLIMDQEIFSLSFWIGPFPVYIDFDLIAHFGFILDATLEGTLSVGTDLNSSGTFDYVCTRDTCTGSNTFDDLFDENGITGSLEFDATAQAYVKTKIRAELYDDDILYAEAGVKGYVEGDIWGFYGNNCGDGDGDGVNETVRALVAGADAGYELIFGIGGLIDDQTWVVGGDRFYLGWWDLLGYGESTALSPIIEGPSLVTVGEPAAYTIRMRPCYPYSEAVTFAMAPNVWNGDFVIDDPASGSETVTKIFGSPQSYDLRAMTVRDAKGRVIHVPQWRTIWAQNPPPPPALVLSYVPAGGGARQTHRSTNANTTPAAQSFFYDPALGNFEQRLEGACPTGSSNSTYVKVSYDGPTIDSCTYRTHLNPGTLTCSPQLVADLNSGKQIILNTDSYEISPSTCGLADPLSAVCTPGQYCWATVNMQIDGETVSRTVAYRK